MPHNTPPKASGPCEKPKAHIEIASRCRDFSASLPRCRRYLISTSPPPGSSSPSTSGRGGSSSLIASQNPSRSFALHELNLPAGRWGRRPWWRGRRAGAHRRRSRSSASAPSAAPSARPPLSPGASPPLTAAAGAAWRTAWWILSWMSSAPGGASGSRQSNARFTLDPPISRYCYILSQCVA
jgi:hypothetical protein